MGDERHGLEVLLRVIGQALVEMRVDRMRGDRAHDKRAAVAGTTLDVAHADAAARTGTVEEHHLFTERLREGKGYRAREDVPAAARRKGDDHRHLRRLRKEGAWCRSCGEKSACELKKSASFHGLLRLNASNGTDWYQRAA